MSAKSTHLDLFLLSSFTPSPLPPACALLSPCPLFLSSPILCFFSFLSQPSSSSFSLFAILTHPLLSSTPAVLLLVLDSCFAACDRTPLSILSTLLAFSSLSCYFPLPRLFFPFPFPSTFPSLLFIYSVPTSTLTPLTLLCSPFDYLHRTNPFVLFARAKKPNLDHPNAPNVSLLFLRRLDDSSTFGPLQP